MGFFKKERESFSLDLRLLNPPSLHMDCLSKFYLYELLFPSFDFTSVFDCLMRILDILHGVNFVLNVVSAKEVPLICEAYLVM